MRLIDYNSEPIIIFQHELFFAFTNILSSDLSLSYNYYVVEIYLFLSDIFSGLLIYNKNCEEWCEFINLFLPLFY